MGPEILAPLTVFGSMVLIFWIIFNANARKREAELKTVRSIVEKTGEASPELIKAIGHSNPVKNADLRKGLIFIAIAVALVGLGVLIGEEDALGPMLGVALFPGLVGIVYVMFHMMGGGREDDQAL